MPTLTPIDPQPPVDDEEPTRVLDAEPGRGGRRIASRYEVLHTLAQGGMAEVLLARHIDLGRYVAVKVIKRDLPGKESVDFETRFRAEARVLASFDHPNIVAIHDFGLLADRRCYLAMEYVEGPTLADLLKRRGPLPVDQLVALVLQITSALRYAHQRGVVHRDLTPSNLIVKRDDDGREVVKIVDFGIAQVGRPDPADTSDVVLGSPHCMSPEQIDGGAVDARTDVYALGATMFRLLTGRWPYTGKDTGAILLGHLQTPVPSIRRVVPDRNLPEALDAVVQRCLAKHPDDRFPTVDALGDALLAATSTPAAGAPSSAVRLSAPAWAALGATVALTVVVGAWGALRSGPAAPAPEARAAEAVATPSTPAPQPATDEAPQPATTAPTSPGSADRPTRADPAPRSREPVAAARPAVREPTPPAPAPTVVEPGVPRGYHGIPDTAWPRSADTARAHHAAGLAAAARRQTSVAVGEFLASWDGVAHPTTARNVARAYEDKGDLKRALTWYERARQLAPQHADAIAVDAVRVREALDSASAASAPAGGAPAVDPGLAAEVERIRASIDAARKEQAP